MRLYISRSVCSYLVLVLALWGIWGSGRSDQSFCPTHRESTDGTESPLLGCARPIMRHDGVMKRRSLMPVFLASCSVRLPAVALVPPPATVVQDRQGFLQLAEEQRLERILTKLEVDTGYKIRVLTQSKATAPELGPLLQSWQIGQGGRLRDPNAVLMVADRGLKGKLEAGGSFLRYEVGDNVRLKVPDTFWGRLQREYGRIRYVESRGEAAAVVTSCELIITCLRDEQGCTDVPDASSSVF